MNDSTAFVGDQESHSDEIARRRIEASQERRVGEATLQFCDDTRRDLDQIDLGRETFQGRAAGIAARP